MALGRDEARERAVGKSDGGAWEWTAELLGMGEVMMYETGELTGEYTMVYVHREVILLGVAGPAWVRE